MLGDFVKGPLPAGLSPELASGVALHRAIDSFAERHPAFVSSRQRVGAKRRRVAGVLVDLFYDHLLARDWADYGSGTLEDYVQEVYVSLSEYHECLPDSAREMSRLMHQQNWLCAYRDLSSLGRVIDRMSVYRFRRENPLAGGVEEFLADAEGFASDFRCFMPDALVFAASWRAKRGG